MCTLSFTTVWSNYSPQSCKTVTVYFGITSIWSFSVLWSSTWRSYHKNNIVLRIRLRKWRFVTVRDGRQLILRSKKPVILIKPCQTTLIRPSDGLATKTVLSVGLEYPWRVLELGTTLLTWRSSSLTFVSTFPTLIACKHKKTPWRGTPECHRK